MPGWRQFEVTSRIEIVDAASSTRAWLPLPSLEEPAWVRNQGNLWAGNAAAMTPMREGKYGAGFLYAEWTDETAPVLEVISRFSARDRTVDFSAPSKAHVLDGRSRKLYTSPTALIPTDGIVRATARKITANAASDLDKARAIYEWVVDNTFRDPKVRGCGLGDIRFMLESGDLGGKCADLNALFVGLCRAVDLPARDVYGVRVADSRSGYRSLGRSGDISKAQHCRAEVWLDDFGWVPVDPADVRKLVLEEKPDLTLADPMVRAARASLFGGWEMNWMPYNVAHDIVLPGASAAKLPFLMYPQAETGGRRLDSLAPENFRYTLASREISD
jgi:transglutaminase-like putative cysteine protease